MAASDAQQCELSRPAAKTGPENRSPPKLCLAFDVQPNVYSLSSGAEAPIITITVTSLADRPITVYSWTTVLNPSVAITRMGIDVTDIELDQRVHLPVANARLGARPQRVMGGTYESHYTTLIPGETQKVSCRFCFAKFCRRINAHDANARMSFDYFGREERTTLELGHHYIVGNQNAGFSWWRWGTKEENLAPKGTPWAETSQGWSEPTLKFFEVKEAVLQIVE